MHPNLAHAQEPVQVATASPTRRTPRIRVNRPFNFKAGSKGVLNTGVALNVSAGGALLFCLRHLDENSAIQVELGPPIFPESRLISSRVRHVEQAPDDLIEVLHQKGKIDEKTKAGYLIGVEYVRLHEADYKTLKSYIAEQLQEERTRHTSDDGTHASSNLHAGLAAGQTTTGQASAPSSHTSHPKDVRVQLAMVPTTSPRAIRVSKPRVPNIVFALGLFVGADKVVTGILNGEREEGIIWQTAVILAVFWLAGRIAVAIWDWLDGMRDENAIILSTTDGTPAPIDDLADAEADTLLNVSARKKEEKSNDAVEDINSSLIHPLNPASAPGSPHSMRAVA